MKRWWIAFVMAVLAMSSVQAKRQAPLIDPPRVAVRHANGSSLSAEQIKVAIVSGAKAIGWVITTDTPGTLVLSYNKQNKHLAVIRATYDAEGYQLHYVNSTNLNYETPVDGGPMIHPNYNNWIINLTRHIKIATDVLSAGEPAAQPTPATPAASR